MRAAVLDRLGADAPFRIAELPVPTPGPGQVRVRVQAIGVNPADVGIRAGLVPLSPPATFPLVLGWDAAGVVDALGAGVTGWSVEDPVIGFSAYLRTQTGTYADYVVLDTDDIAPLPAGWSTLDAATLPSSGLTALQALDATEITAGDQLVVVGAAGMVGGLITQIAAARGARVIAVVSARDTALARQLGASAVVDRTSDVAAAVGDLAPAGADAAINAARGAGPLTMTTIRDHGRFATIADNPPPPPQRGITPREVLVDSNGTQLRELSKLAGAHTVTARRSETLRLDDADRAHNLIGRGGLAGKVVLQNN